ncbi:lymphocyte activation gene 3 protein [Scleropages formosus]|uniref:lymphocyte activation gene 3 protein n=1 Tax=Scleropages formosus TaxID=113540 RepID=UPI000877F6A4|nr:lymphocyte activation gene 3 protein [Scleropages formosus]
MLLLVVLLGTALSIKGGSSEETEVLVSAGSTAVLPCEVSGLSSPIRVLWTRSSQRQSRNQVQTTVWRVEPSGMEFRGVGVGQRSRCSHANFNKGDFSLQIENVSAEDGGEYFCTVTNQRKTTKKQVILRVIEVSVTSHQPVEGSDVVITCNIMPPVSMVTVNWSFNGSSFPADNRDRLQRRQRKGVTDYEILGVSPRHTGTWTCIVQHNGNEGKASQSLTVAGITSPAQEMIQVYAEVGSLAWLPCVYTVGVVPEHPSWSRDSDSLSPFKGLPSLFRASSQSSRPPWDQSAEIERVDARDQGMYRCSGTLEGKRVQRQLQLVTAQVVTTGLKNTPKTLICQLSNTTGISSYEWVWVTNDASGSQAVTPFHWEKSLNIDKIQRRGPGECLCRYFGKQGILGNATYHEPFTYALQGEKKPGNVSAGMITGLVIFFLVLLLIVLQMYKNYRRRKMILPYPALETIVHSSVNAQEHNRQNRADTKVKNQQTTV